MRDFIDMLMGFADWFWGLPVLFIIGGGSLYCSLRTGFVQIRKFPYICSQTFGNIRFSRNETKTKGVSSFSAATAALASSIGASNIVGVPFAIVWGGPGAVFWMWIFAVLGAGAKYSEIVLGLKYRERNKDGEYTGGPFYYCSKGIKNRGLGKFLAIWFSVFLMLELIPSVATQSAAAIANAETLGFSPATAGCFMALIVCATAAGGFQRISSVTDKMVPAMAGIYIIGCLVVIAANRERLPQAISDIFLYAFMPHAAVGGFAGSTMAASLRWGAARGVYSNEAGMGTASIAHAAAAVDHPVQQGIWGVFEVTVDTLIICTITALCVLCSGMWTEASVINGSGPGSVPSLAFRSVFGATGDMIVTGCIFFFVLSTLIVSVFYGQKQAEFLFGTRFSRFWKYVYILAILGGISGGLDMLYPVTDFFLAMVIVPNMIALVLLSGDVKELTCDFFHTKKRR